MRIFVDTSALIALADRSDQYHKPAKAFLQTLQTAQLHTSSYVLDETITRLRFTAGVQVAVKVAESLWSSELYEIHPVDQRIERLALGTMKKFSDHQLSFTDCTTIVLMEHLQLERIFAFDDDFRKAGYLLAP